MSDWLGVDDGFDAKGAGSDIGSWDNFDDDGWKGGAAGLVTMSEDELRDAITSMGDDELLGHDIWFVATGASECGNAGMKAFLDEHRDKLRGVFLINLESIGAGTLATLTTEGRNRVLGIVVLAVWSRAYRPISIRSLPTLRCLTRQPMRMPLWS